ARLDLEIRQLQLFPEPVDDVVDLELEDELIAALVVAARTLARAALRRPREHVARLAVTLADALRLVLAAQPEAPVLEKAYGDLDRRIGTREDVALRDELGQPLADCGTHLVVMPQPVAGAARKQVVPLALGSAALDESRPVLHAI